MERASIGFAVMAYEEVYSIGLAVIAYEKSLFYWTCRHNTCTWYKPILLDSPSLHMKRAFSIGLAIITPALDTSLFYWTQCHEKKLYCIFSCYFFPASTRVEKPSLLLEYICSSLDTHMWHLSWNQCFRNKVKPHY